MPLGDEPTRLARPDGATIAYHATVGKSPGVIFCGGFRSDMEGTKALALEASCRAAGRAYVRFDYFGHGRSSGDFRDGTIGRWAEDTLAVLDALSEGPQVLVGSSMGGWVMLLAALARPARVAGMVGIAPATDFTEELMWARFPDDAKAALLRDGFWHEPSAYSQAPYPITLRLIEEGRRHLLLGGAVPFAGPVRILQGMRDPDVPWRHALRLVEALQAEDVRLTLVKDGDHRLSRPADTELLASAVESLCRQLAG